MTDDLSNLNLDLLVPWDLPTDLTLSIQEKEVVTHALAQLITSLEQEKIKEETMVKCPFKESIALINQAIATLGTGHQSIPNTTKEKISLKQWEIIDYDRYFNIQHIESETPAICIVRSVLLTYRQFLYLCNQNPNLDPNNVIRQRQGFEAIALLLTRIFNLE
ncbi:MAG: hypothetical protein AAGD25_00125 [Cyanobacteria bacterium P01_F01_bin.150]